jgi:hypothetical protein
MVRPTTSPPDTEAPQGWTCSFFGRAGALARATFSSLREATAFAERHAALSEAALGACVCDADGTWLAETLGGQYQLQSM